jgi:hypothetical protein
MQSRQTLRKTNAALSMPAQKTTWCSVREKGADIIYSNPARHNNTPVVHLQEIGSEVATEWTSQEWSITVARCSYYLIIISFYTLYIWSIIRCAFAKPRPGTRHAAPPVNFQQTTMAQNLMLPCGFDSSWPKRRGPLPFGPSPCPSQFSREKFMVCLGRACFISMK